MASFRKIVGLVACALGLVGCYTEHLDPPSIVVEGWIEAGKTPVVMLHKSYVFSWSDTASISLQENIGQQLVIFGRVAIFDGQDSVVLTGRMDTNYMPPYIYTTTEMVGVEGRTYTLHAHYSGYDAASVTTIPKVARFDSIVAVELHPSQMQLIGYMSGVDEDGYYMVMAKKLEARQYKVCPMGVFAGSQATNGKKVVTIYCPKLGKVGLEEKNNKEEEEKEKQKNESEAGITSSLLFPKSEEGYSIKIARIDEASYRFWDQFAAQSATQGVLFMSVYKNLPTNIVDGLGIWSGMGATAYHLKIDKAHTFVFNQP